MAPAQGNLLQWCVSVMVNDALFRVCDADPPPDRVLAMMTTLSESAGDIAQSVDADELLRDCSALDSAAQVEIGRCRGRLGFFLDSATTQLERDCAVDMSAALATPAWPWVCTLGGRVWLAQDILLEAVNELKALSEEVKERCELAEGGTCPSPGTVSAAIRSALAWQIGVTRLCTDCTDAKEAGSFYGGDGICDTHQPMLRHNNTLICAAHELAVSRDDLGGLCVATDVLLQLYLDMITPICVDAATKSLRVACVKARLGVASGFSVGVMQLENLGWMPPAGGGFAGWLVGWGGRGGGDAKEDAESDTVMVESAVRG